MKDSEPKIGRRDQWTFRPQVSPINGRLPAATTRVSPDRLRLMEGCFALPLRENLDAMLSDIQNVARQWMVRRLANRLRYRQTEQASLDNQA